MTKTLALIRNDMAKVLRVSFDVVMKYYKRKGYGWSWVIEAMNEKMEREKEGKDNE